MAFLKDRGVRCLALDVDGTLYPRWMLNARMVRSFFPSGRLALSFNRVRSHYRSLQEEEETIPPTREGLLMRQAALVAGRMGRLDAHEVQRAIDRQFYEAWERSFLTIKPCDGLRETLVQVKDQGLTIAVLSDFPIARKLETLAIADLVDHAYCSEESGYLKPSPHAFSLLLDGLGYRADEFLYVGDSYTKDCVGAQDVGMYTALLTGRTSRSYPGVDLVIDSWTELAALIL